MNETEIDWTGVSAEQRQEIEEAIAGIVARFKEGGPGRSLSDCMDRCAEMEQAAQAHCEAIAGSAAAAACAAHAAAAGHACVKSCYSHHGVPHD